MNNNKDTLQTIISLFCFILLLALITIIGNSIYSIKIENNKNKESTITEKKTEKKENILQKSKELLQIFDIIKNDINNKQFWYIKEIPITNYEKNKAKYFGYLYKQEKISKEQMSDDIKTLLVLKKLNLTTKQTNETCEQIISESELVTTYQQIFGKNENFKLPENTTLFPKIQNKENEIIVNTCSKESIQEKGHTILTKSLNSEKKENELYIYEVATLVEEIEDKENITYNLYKDFEKKEQIASNIAKSEIFNNDNLQKMQKYKYTFKLEDNNYYFSSIEKVEN